VQAVVLGLTTPPYNLTANLEWIPNMDGFPNGRRLEDDVTRIELQAVSGVALAGIGLWYDDYLAGSPNPVTPNLLSVLGYTTGVEENDTTFNATFPYMQTPWSGTGKCSGKAMNYTQPVVLGGSVGVGLSAPEVFATASPNPFSNQTTFRYRLTKAGTVRIEVYTLNGQRVYAMPSQVQAEGEYRQTWDAAGLPAGVYVARVISADNSGERVVQSFKLVKAN
jgi:hypothetical protein